MKIVSLIDDIAANGYRAEHGVCFYVELCGARLLFDLGQSGLFAENARRADIDLSGIDAAVLSHGHNDHGGGISALTAINLKIPIYAREGAFEPHFNPSGKDLTVPNTHGNESIVTLAIGEVFSPLKGVTLVDFFDKISPQVSPNSFTTQSPNGTLTADAFSHEQYMVTEENGKRTLFSGCSHKGIVEIAKFAHKLGVSTIVGGFHLHKVDCTTEVGLQKLDETASALRSLNMRYVTCHCTGLPQYERLSCTLGDAITYLNCGDCVEF